MLLCPPKAWRLRQCLGIAVSHSSCGSRGPGAAPVARVPPRPALMSRGFLAGTHRGGLPSRCVSAARAGVRWPPENGEPRALCQAPVLPAADHADLSDQGEWAQTPVVSQERGTVPPWCWAPLAPARDGVGVSPALPCPPGPPSLSASSPPRAAALFPCATYGMASPRLAHAL